MHIEMYMKRDRKIFGTGISGTSEFNIYKHNLTEMGSLHRSIPYVLDLWHKKATYYCYQGFWFCVQ